MTRFWIHYVWGVLDGIRTVDMSEGDLLAGFDPIDTMWVELIEDVGIGLPVEERSASVLRSEVLEERTSPIWW